MDKVFKVEITPGEPDGYRYCHAVWTYPPAGHAYTQAQRQARGRKLSKRWKPRCCRSTKDRLPLTWWTARPFPTSTPWLLALAQLDDTAGWRPERGCSRSVTGSTTGGQPHPRSGPPPHGGPHRPRAWWRPTYPQPPGPGTISSDDSENSCPTSAARPAASHQGTYPEVHRTTCSPPARKPVAAGEQQACSPPRAMWSRTRSFLPFLQGQEQEQHESPGMGMTP